MEAIELKQHYEILVDPLQEEQQQSTPQIGSLNGHDVTYQPIISEMIRCWYCTTAICIIFGTALWAGCSDTARPGCDKAMRTFGQFLVFCGGVMSLPICYKNCSLNWIFAIQDAWKKYSNGRVSV